MHTREIEAAGVTVSGYGVVPLGKDSAANRRTFEFAKARACNTFRPIPTPMRSTRSTG